MNSHIKKYMTFTSSISWAFDIIIISLFMMWKRGGHPFNISLNTSLFIISVLLNMIGGYFCWRLFTDNKSSGLKAAFATAYVFTFKTATFAILVVAKFSG